MGRDGAERATPKATTMDVNREFYHLEGRDNLALIFGVRKTGIRKVV
ncbi:hypothetical protein EVA_09692 [gut metagenome]|uniref:Uncharacterized protein n=1 Tax=gut metagenome TaxID=749906 RepID=J9G5Q5_9ZZZZ